MTRIITLRVELVVHRPSLTPELFFIEVRVPSQKSERSYVLGVSIAAVSTVSNWILELSVKGSLCR